MLKILHTADWHVGRSFGMFNDTDAQKLARERITAIDRILGVADRYAVDAVLCAGDLFDSPHPGDDWWGALGDRLHERAVPARPVVLLPGNHDPITPDSVYAPSHPFRRGLPEHIHVVDSEEFKLPIGAGATVYAAPCTSQAGDRDLAMSLPARAADDDGIRIGLVHGSTFQAEGYTTNFPISREATRERGLDYLALGDTHSWQEVNNGDVAPMLYPGAPEPTSFSEANAGNVAIVSFRRHGARPKIRQEKVARWTWRDETVRSLADLRHLATSDLKSTVLRLKLDMSVGMVELEEVDRTLNALRGTSALTPRTGAFVCDRTHLRVNVRDWSLDETALPEPVTSTIHRLQTQADRDPTAQRALLILRRLLHEDTDGAIA